MQGNIPDGMILLLFYFATGVATNTGRRYAGNTMITNKNGFRRVGVYCASAMGKDPAFQAEAEALGRGIGAAGMGLVYGGAIRGLMGALANSALSAGAEVVGVLPDALKGREIAHNGITRLELVGTMHERKARISELADALIALPGGYGTLDELLEAVTWAQIGIHHKPCILVNTLNYWDGLLAFIDTAVDCGFVTPENRALLRVAASAEEALSVANSLVSGIESTKAGNAG
jgi:uncharacterized protein (TIGR00730 family)